MPPRAKIYVRCVIAAGGAIVLSSLAGWHPGNQIAWLVLLALTLVSSVVKLRLPGYEGTFSLNYLFLLYGVIHFSLPETVAACVVGALAQSLLNRKARPQPVQVLFNAANLVISVAACSALLWRLGAAGYRSDSVAAVVAVATTYFLINTAVVSGILALLEGRRPTEVCERWYVWLLPYYLVGVVILTWTMVLEWSHFLEVCLVLLPLLYLIHFFVGLLEVGPLNGRLTAESDGDQLPPAARGYLVAVASAGAVMLTAALGERDWASLPRFALYLAVAVAASALKVKLPGVTGTISIGFVPLLVAISELGFSECVSIAVAQGVVQSLWRPKRRPNGSQVLFNSAALSLSAGLAYLLAHSDQVTRISGGSPGKLIAAAAVLYSVNTGVIAAMICLATKTPLARMFRYWHFLSFPYYLVGASVAGIAISTGHSEGWLSVLLVLPVMVTIYFSYRMHVREPEHSG